MKKITISIISIIMYFIFFSKVEAAGTISLSASKTSVNIGDTFTVSINLSGASVATLTARVSFDTSKVDYVSGPSNSNLSGGRVIYTWTDPTGGSSPLTGGTIATFTFKAKVEGNVSFSVSGNFFTPEETSVNPSFSGTTVNIKKVETINPGGNTGTGTEGDSGGNTNNGTGGGTGVKPENGGTQTGGTQTGGNQGDTSGSIGNNTGTSGSNNAGSNGGNNTGNNGNATGGNTQGNTGTTTNPPINNNAGTGNDTTNNQQTKSSNNNLKSLQLNIEGISPTFNKNQTQYYITIPENISNITITAIPEDSKASVQILGNTNIQVGNSKISIIVIAENGNKKEYAINVTKTNNTELSNANLENLAIENVTLVPEFNADITDYTAEISTDIDRLNILAIPQQEAATVTIEGNENLQVGDNFIKITVLAQDGQTSKVYNITVQKKENIVDEVKNNDSANDIEENNVNNENKENIENAMENEVKINNIAWIIGIIVLATLIIGVIIYIFKKKNKIFKIGD